MQHLTNNTIVPTLPDHRPQGIHNFFLPCQLRFINDPSRKRIVEKSRQVGISLTAAYDLVNKPSPPGSSSDAWVSSRDGFQPQLFGQDSANWARLCLLPSALRKYPKYALLFAIVRYYALLFDIMQKNFPGVPAFMSPAAFPFAFFASRCGSVHLCQSASICGFPQPSLSAIASAAAEAFSLSFACLDRRTCSTLAQRRGHPAVRPFNFNDQRR
jgi:hypothetical protein